MKRVEIITVWYNEEFFAPYFCEHYDWVDTIHIVVDEKTNDKTLERLLKFKNIRLHSIVFPNGFDDSIKVGKVNSIFQTLDCDWILALDSDEFLIPQLVTPRYKTVLKDWFNLKTPGIYFIKMLSIIENRKDFKLNHNLPLILQRHAGIDYPDEWSGQESHKPIICSPGSHLGWDVGNHRIIRASQPQFFIDELEYAHMNLCSRTEAYRRLIFHRRDVLSDKNKQMGWGYQNFNIDKEKIDSYMDSRSNCESIIKFKDWEL